MAQVEIYTTVICPYCVRAKALLAKKGVAYTEIDASADPQVMQTMINRAGGKRTVPQIFIDNQHVGGCDELYALDRQGKLDPLLGLAA
jgi:glutaredoxin 3